MLLGNRSKMVGVDIGGSHITASLIDLENQCVAPESVVRNPVNTNGSADEILSTWVNAIREVVPRDEINHVRIGVAMPGPFDYKHGISLITGMNKYESLYMVDIRAHLINELGISADQILFRNDAEAFLHGEAHCGAARGYNKALGITLGTGLGSAVHENGITKDANLGVSTFHNGIAEDYLSTRWFVKRYSALSGLVARDAKAILDTVSTNPAAAEVLQGFIDNLATFLYAFIKAENPDVVIIGGNIAKGHLLFVEAVNAKLVNLGCSVTVKVTSLWEDAAMIGAASYWKMSAIAR
jgi:glucokinase